MLRISLSHADKVLRQQRALSETSLMPCCTAHIQQLAWQQQSQQGMATRTAQPCPDLRHLRTAQLDEAALDTLPCCSHSRQGSSRPNCVVMVGMVGMRDGRTFQVFQVQLMAEARVAHCCSQGRIVCGHEGWAGHLLRQLQHRLRQCSKRNTWSIQLNYSSQQTADSPTFPDPVALPACMRCIPCPM